MKDTIACSEPLPLSTCVNSAALRLEYDPEWDLSDNARAVHL